jgi:hypothetical protein
MSHHPVCTTMQTIRTITALLTAATLCAASLMAQQAEAPVPEVRQIVTFLFQPGRAAEASAIYEAQLKPINADVGPLLRFRAYREAESPEPLDLVVVSSYRGMAGMDAANDALRRPHPSGRSAFGLYGTLSAMTQSHHDQFVEMLPPIGNAPDDSAGITVFEYLRVPTADQPRFVFLLDRFRRAEQSAGLYRWSEMGRMLVSDGWDFLRIHHMRSLADWQRYRTYQRSQTTSDGPLRLITARKTIILKQDGRLSVR